MPLSLFFDAFFASDFFPSSLRHCFRFRRFIDMNIAAFSFDDVISIAIFADADFLWCFADTLITPHAIFASFRCWPDTILALRFRYANIFFRFRQLLRRFLPCFRFSLYCWYFAFHYMLLIFRRFSPCWYWFLIFLLSFLAFAIDTFSRWLIFGHDIYYFLLHFLIAIYIY